MASAPSRPYCVPVRWLSVSVSSVKSAGNAACVPRRHRGLHARGVLGRGVRSHAARRSLRTSRQLVEARERLGVAVDVELLPAREQPVGSERPEHEQRPLEGAPAAADRAGVRPAHEQRVGTQVEDVFDVALRVVDELAKRTRGPRRTLRLHAGTRSPRCGGPRPRCPARTPRPSDRCRWVPPAASPRPSAPSPRRGRARGRRGGARRSARTSARRRRPGDRRRRTRSAGVVPARRPRPERSARSRRRRRRTSRRRDRSQTTTSGTARASRRALPASSCRYVRSWARSSER